MRNSEVRGDTTSYTGEAVPQPQVDSMPFSFPELGNQSARGQSKRPRVVHEQPHCFCPRRAQTCPTPPIVMLFLIAGNDHAYRCRNSNAAIRSSTADARPGPTKAYECFLLLTLHCFVACPCKIQPRHLDRPGGAKAELGVKAVRDPVTARDEKQELREDKPSK